MSKDELPEADRLLTRKQLTINLHESFFNDDAESPTDSLVNDIEYQDIVDANKSEESESLASINKITGRPNVDSDKTNHEMYITSLDLSADSLEKIPESLKTSFKSEEGSDMMESLEGSTEESSIISEEQVPEEACYKQDENNPIEFLDRELFPTLLPCLEDVLFAAKENIVLKVQKSRFNGLDYLAELLWNRNPLHPERHHSHIPVFEIPFVKTFLEESPRPIFPKSWLWTQDQAAVIIQAAVRGYLVRRQPEVQELRQFWKTVAKENKPVTEEREYPRNFSKQIDHISLFN